MPNSKTMLAAIFALSLAGCVDDLDEPSLEATAQEVVPPAPSLNVEYVGCFSGAPRFLFDWYVGSQYTPAYDVDIKRGSLGTWTDLYNGTNETRIYNGVANRYDTVRVRACNASGCGSFTSQAFHSACVPAP